MIPDFYVPIVNQEQVDGVNLLNERGKRWVFTVMGHLKPGVTPAQAVADLNSIGVYLGRTYPKDDAMMIFCCRGQGLRRFSWASSPGIHDGIDVAGWINFAGRLRELGQPVCRTRSRPFP